MIFSRKPPEFGVAVQQIVGAARIPLAAPFGYSFPGRGPAERQPFLSLADLTRMAVGTRKEST